MKTKRVLIITVFTLILILGAFVGIQNIQVNPNQGGKYSALHLILPGKKPLIPEIPGGGSSISTIRYAYGLLPGGFLNPNHVELEVKLNGTR